MTRRPRAPPLPPTVAPTLTRCLGHSLACEFFESRDLPLLSLSVAHVPAGGRRRTGRVRGRDWIRMEWHGAGD